MAGTDQPDDEGRDTGKLPGPRKGGWLARAATWSAAVAAGLLLVLVGAGMDAWRHNNSGARDALTDMTQAAHVVALVGLAVTALAALAGFSLSMLRGQRGAEGARRRYGPLAGVLLAVGVAAIGVVAYIAVADPTVGTGGMDMTAAQMSDQDAAAASDAAGVAAGLKQQGIIADGANPDPASVPGALGQGANGTAGVMHDMGKQPTFTQIETMPAADVMPLFPANTVSEADYPALKAQIEQVRAVAEAFPTTEAAAAAGYVRTTSDVPFMGEHWLNYDLVRKGIFDPARPQGLLFSKVDAGPEKLVGVWFLLVPGINGITRDTEPQGFIGNLDMWHAHTGLCLVGLSGASDNETKESCTAKGGSFTADLRWMMHVWVAPLQDNPDGVFTYLNNDLFQKQQAAAKLNAPTTGQVGQ